ncbi:MAG: hypothetical protein ABIY50_01180, partial [Ignavibacteria bacterium]
VGGSTKGYIKCNEMISEGTDSSVSTLGLNDSNDQITIDVNYIEGNSSQVVYSFGSSTNPGNFVLKNAKIKNKSTSTSAKGILLATTSPKLTLNRVKIIAGNQNGNIISLGSGTSIEVKNYGLFGNYDIDDTKIILKVGVGTTTSDPGYNYQGIIDPLLK